jgi:hypothetical protein
VHEAPGEARFGKKTSFRFVIGQAGFREEFEGYGAAQIAISSPVHLGIRPAEAFQQFILSNAVG